MTTRFFSEYEKSIYLSTSNDIVANKIPYNSNKYYDFDCVCGHTINLRINNVVRGTWCAFCPGKKLCSDPECEFCLKNSLAGHKLAKYIIPREGQNLHRMTPKVKEIIDIKCPDCHHILTKPALKINDKCGYCVLNNLCGDAKCLQCRKKSVADLPLMIWWSEHNKERPYAVKKNSKHLYKFICPLCKHGVTMAPAELTKKNRIMCGCYRGVCEKDDCLECDRIQDIIKEKDDGWFERHQRRYHKHYIN